MFALGIIGILQVLLIPGLIIQRFLILPKGFWIKASAIIGLSLITNYLFVFFMTLLDIFTQFSVLVLVLLESITLIYFYRKEIWTISLDDSLAMLWNGLITPIYTLFPQLNSKNKSKKSEPLLNIFSILLFIAAIIAIELIFRIFRYNIGEIFNTWDAVLSWNKWAVSWANNIFPIQTEDYPQLVPTNWAMIYVIIGNTSVQFFAKSIMPIFSLMIMFTLLSFGIQFNNAGFFISVITLRLVFKKFLNEYIASGYTDIPLTFFSLISILFLMLLQKETDEHRKINWWILSTIFASGAAITKQAGLYILAINLILGFYFIFGLKIRRAFQSNWKALLTILILAFMIVAPWYGTKAIQFAMGIGQSHLATPVQSTNHVHQQNSIIATAISAFGSLDKYFYFFLIAIPAFIFVDKFWRWILVLVVVPYTLIWSVYASYDTRNLALTFPLYTTIIGLGLWSFTKWTLTQLKKIRFFQIKLIIPLFLIIGGIVLGLTFKYDSTFLENKQVELQTQLFSPNLNQQLISYFADKPSDISVLTPYPLDYIPGLHGQVTFFFNDLEQFRDYVNSESIDYILYPGYTAQSIKNDIANGEEEGKFTEILSNSDWIPYTLIEINNNTN